jgi:hypothetical protein
MKPTPTFLKPGDGMRVGIAKPGEQAQSVIAYRSASSE